MKEKWFLGYKTKAEREERRQQVQSFKAAFGELEKLLVKMKVNPANRNYSEAGWSHKQIANNERNHTIEEILELIKG